jgi:hypothetical protein
MIRSLRMLVPGACALLFASRARAGSDTGLALGVRSGYAMPSGKVGATIPGWNAQDMSATVKGTIPIGLDVGYRITSAVYLGGSFQYAVGFANKDEGALCQRLDCSVRVTTFGGDLRLRLLRSAALVPWIGVGVGYEIMTADETELASARTGAQLIGSLTVKGLQFVIVHLGGDFMASRRLTVGPYVSVSLGKYSAFSSKEGAFSFDPNGPPTYTVSRSGDLNDTQLHRWFTIGLRAQFNL